MNTLVHDYYGKEGFEDLIELSQEKWSWEEAARKFPYLSRGWYELSRLAKEDRVEFTLDFWLTLIPFVPNAHEKIRQFFARLEDVSIILAKKGGAYFPECVYLFKEGNGFFRGALPCSREEIDGTNMQLDGALPRDFLSFLRIHNGFGKAYDSGILRMEELFSLKKELENFLMGSEKRIHCDGIAIDPDSLIPFYKSAGGYSYQCFYADWYPSSEIGNVYLSLREYTISRYILGSSEETLAFPTFLNWLVFYLEGIEI
jgi:hypothetical protein